MKIVRLFLVLAILGLLSTACRVSTPTVTETVSGNAGVLADESVIDPNWHLTAEKLAATNAGTGSSIAATASQEAPPIEEELNDGAAFDVFIMERFPDAGPAQYAPLQTVVGGYCLGLVDEDSIGLLTQDQAIQRVVLDMSDDECTSMETSSVLITSRPVDASSWDEAVTRRFARTIWWYDESEFAARAVQACQAGESVTALSSDFALSVSVVVELAAFTRHGDCALLTVADGATTQTVTASDAGTTVTERNEDVTVYFLRASDEENIADRIRDLYALSVQRGEVTRLTTGLEVSDVALSPDGSELAYLAKDEQDSEASVAHVVDLASGTDRVVGTVNYITSLTWTPDGRSLVHSEIAEDGNRYIALLDTVDGTSRIAVASADGDVWQEGFSGNHLLYRDADDALARYDVAIGATIDNIDVPYGALAVAPDGSQVIVSARSTGELSLIDMTAETLTSAGLTSGPGLEAWPSISPDNRYVAYGVGPEFAASEIYITEIAAPDVRINLTAETETSKVGRAMWSPDSQAVFFSDGQFDVASMFVATIDGKVTDLGEVGRILLVANN